MSYRLHYSPDSANIIIHMILEELDLPYELVMVDRSVGAHKQPNFFKLNPQGLIPVLEDDGQAIFETAAIALHLADKHQKLIPQLPGSRERAVVLQWLFYLSNTLHADIRLLFSTKDYITGSSQESSLTCGVKRRINEHLSLIERQLNDNGSDPWFFGTDPGILDFYLGPLCRWICLYPVDNTFENSIWQNYPKLANLLDNLEHRAAVARAFEQEKINPPYFRNPSLPKLPVSFVTG